MSAPESADAADWQSIIDDARGRRSLYLDGVPFYRSGDFDAFNVYLAEVPGELAVRDGPFEEVQTAYLGEDRTSE